MTTNEDVLYLEDADLLLARGSNDFYEPIVHSINKDTGEGTELTRGDFFYDFLMFIKFSEKKKISSGKNIGKYKEGFAEIYQYYYAFKALGLASRMQAERLIGVFSRQALIGW